jgi:hypothetical protein
VTLCVYALTGSRARVSATGLAGERLRVYTQGSVAAVAGQLTRKPDASPDLLRRYDGAMRRLADTLPALLPARFGTCFQDPEELAFVLRSRGPSLARALAHVRNRVQMTVRLIESSVPPGPAKSRQASAPSRPTRRGSGAAYLRARAQAAARDRDVGGFETVRRAVQRWLRDERVERRGAVVSVYHLIPRTSAPRYRRAVAAAAAACGLRVVISGPWPAYAFADTLSSGGTPA